MIIVIMGVAGAGKTTVGRLLASELGWPFHDADDLHSPENVTRMSSGTPLTDDDRGPWLLELQALIRGIEERSGSAVLACSALTESFRSRLASAASEVTFVHLRNSPALLEERLEEREGHYMKAGMLRSQLEALEEPADALLLEVGSDGPRAVARRIRQALNL